MGVIRVGTASWTDRTLLASGWYPPGVNTPEKRLRFYASQFPLVEADVDPAVTDQAWDRFLSALEPLHAAGKLGAILLQFPPWFPMSGRHKDYILCCAQRAAPRRVCVEFRNSTWMNSRQAQKETLSFLASHELPYVCVDMPQGHPSSIPPVLAVTAAQWTAKIRDLADGAETTDVLFNNCCGDNSQVNARQLTELLA